MKNMGIVQGNAAQAVPLVVGKDTVYVHTDIKRLPVDENHGGELYEYHEVQYGKDEFIQRMAEQEQDSLEQRVDLDFRVCMLELGL